MLDQLSSVNQADSWRTSTAGHNEWNEVFGSAMSNNKMIYGILEEFSKILNFCFFFSFLLRAQKKASEVGGVSPPGCPKREILLVPVRA